MKKTVRMLGDDKRRISDSEALSELSVVTETDPGEPYIVAVLDTGLRSEHPLLQGKILDSRDFTGEGPEDVNGHGTSLVTSIGIPILGPLASQVRYLNVKVLDRDGDGFEDDFVAGLEWAAQWRTAGGKSVDVIKLALGVERESPCNGCDVCYTANRIVSESTILVIAATGNRRDRYYCPSSRGGTFGRPAVSRTSPGQETALEPWSLLGLVDDLKAAAVELETAGEYREVAITLIRLGGALYWRARSEFPKIDVSDVRDGESVLTMALHFVHNVVRPFDARLEGRARSWRARCRTLLAEIDPAANDAAIEDAKVAVEALKRGDSAAIAGDLAHAYLHLARAYFWRGCWHRGHKGWFRLRRDWRKDFAVTRNSVAAARQLAPNDWYVRSEGQWLDEHAMS